MKELSNVSRILLVFIGIVVMIVGGIGQGFMYTFSHWNIDHIPSSEEYIKYSPQWSKVNEIVLPYISKHIDQIPIFFALASIVLIFGVILLLKRKWTAIVGLLFIVLGLGSYIYLMYPFMLLQKTPPSPGSIPVLLLFVAAMLYVLPAAATYLFFRERFISAIAAGIFPILGGIFSQPILVFSSFAIGVGAALVIGVVQGIELIKHNTKGRPVLPKKPMFNRPFEIMQKVTRTKMEDRGDIEREADQTINRPGLSMEEYIDAWYHKFCVKLYNWASKEALDIAKVVSANADPFIGLWMQGDAWREMADRKKGVVEYPKDEIKLALDAYGKAAELNVLYAPLWAKASMTLTIAEDFANAERLLQIAMDIDIHDPEVKRANYMLAEAKFYKSENKIAGIGLGLIGLGITGLFATVGFSIYGVAKTTAEEQARRKKI